MDFDMLLLVVMELLAHWKEYLTFLVLFYLFLVVLVVVSVYVMWCLHCAWRKIKRVYGRLAGRTLA